MIDYLELLHGFQDEKIIGHHKEGEKNLSTVKTESAKKNKR